MSGDHTAHSSSKDVCACCWIQAEGSGEVNSLWQLASSPKPGPQGRHICNPAGRVPDLQGRNRVPLPTRIHAQQVAWTPTVLAQMGMGGNKGHFVFLERLPKGRGEVHSQEEVENWSPPVIVNPAIGQSLSDRKAGHFRWMRAHWGQGGPPVGPGGCCCIRGVDRKAQ